MAQTSNPSNVSSPRRWFGGHPMQALRQEIDNLFESFSGGRTLPGMFMGEPLRLDLLETPEAVVVLADVPGYRTEEIEIDISHNVLTITCERPEEEKVDSPQKTYHRVERRAGRVSRCIWLPCEVQEDRTEAQLKDGVLTIRLPKAEQAKHRKIPVKS